MAVNTLAKHLSALCPPLSSRLGCLFNTPLGCYCPASQSLNMGLIFSLDPHSPNLHFPMLPSSVKGAIYSGQKPRSHPWFFFPSSATPLTRFCWLCLQKPPHTRCCHLSLAPLPWHSSLAPLLVLHSPHSGQSDPFIQLLKTPQQLPLRE